MQEGQALIQQIEELTKQNNMLVTELLDVKEKLQQNQNEGQNGNGGSSNKSGGNSSQSQNSGSNGGSNPTAQLAGELKKLKGMVQSLETKMSEFATTQSSGKLTQADVVNLLLTVMDGMIDWSVDFVSNQSASGSSGGNSSMGNSSQQMQ